MPRKPKPILSKCCQAPVESKVTEPKPWQTNFWSCTKCGEPCDLYFPKADFIDLKKKDIKSKMKVKLKKKTYPIQVPDQLEIKGIGTIFRGDQIFIDVEKGQVTDVRIERKRVPFPFTFGLRQVEETRFREEVTI